MSPRSLTHPQRLVLSVTLLDVHPVIIILICAVRPARHWAQAAGRVPLLPSWGQQWTQPRYTGPYHSRRWCSWSTGQWSISAHSHHTGREQHSSSHTSSLVVSLREQRKERNLLWSIQWRLMMIKQNYGSKERTYMYKVFYITWIVHLKNNQLNLITGFFFLI